MLIISMDEQYLNHFLQEILNGKIQTTIGETLQKIEIVYLNVIYNIH